MALQHLCRVVGRGASLRLAPPQHLTIGQLRAGMAYDSSNESHKKIKNIIEHSQKDVFLFMKGQPSEPKCGYSGVVVQVLDAYGVEYDSFDVLSDDGVRQAIKSYSDWPTIPQVFKKGDFVGGCDILLQMHQSGELEKLFEVEGGGGGAGGEKKK